MRNKKTGCFRAPGFCVQKYFLGGWSRTYHYIVSLFPEKALYIDVAVFGKKCYTNARRTSKWRNTISRGIR